VKRRRAKRWREFGRGSDSPSFRLTSPPVGTMYHVTLATGMAGWRPARRRRGRRGRPLRSAPATSPPGGAQTAHSQLGRARPARSISRQGTAHLRWGLVQAAQTRRQADGPLKATYERIKRRRGRQGGQGRRRPRDPSPSTAYSASKAAVHRFSEILAAQLAPHGIPVYRISHGLVRTEITAGSFGDDAPKGGPTPQRRGCVLRSRPRRTRPARSLLR
jgi:hypothetical protein